MSDSERIEQDSLGEVRIPAGALWGAQTQRAVENFQISGRALPARMIEAILQIKSCAAAANAGLGVLDRSTADAIRAACREIVEKHLDDQFPVDIFQTGSGTSSNMNVNEVVANLASRGSAGPVHPNDHVNMSQSSNDVIPTAMRIAVVVAVREQLLPTLAQLDSALGRKISEHGEVVKTGRTHLMDALPISVAQAWGAWRTQLARAAAQVESASDMCKALPQGGTAVGTGVNAPAGFAAAFIAELNQALSADFRESEDKVADIAGQEPLVALSGALRLTAVALTKIANDLRWMNSGPLAGIGEISLPALQPGSSIMPGKVNPVIAESVLMVCAQVMGNDHTIALAGQSGNFELNVMLPVMASNVLESVELLANAADALADKAINGLVFNEEHIAERLGQNPILVTALNPIIGYDLAAKIAKAAYTSKRPIIDVAEEMTELSREELTNLLDPLKMTHPE